MLRLALALLLLAPAAARATPGDPPPPESPTPFSPDASRFGAYLRFGYLWVTDPRFDLVGDQDLLSRIEVGVSWSPEALADMALELGYAGGNIEAPIFGFGNAALALHSIQAAALYRVPTSATTRAFARGLASLDFANLELTGDGSALEDTVLLLGLEGTVGWELLIPLGTSRTADGRPRRHLDLGLEAGYAFRPIEATFELERNAEDDVRPGRIERIPIGVGAMDLSAWVLRLGGALRF